MNAFIKNKRGFLLAEETLKIIVAVICIIFLVYILVSIYNSNTSAKKIEEAKDVLLRVETIVTALTEGEIESQDVSNPQGWHIYTFTEEIKPNSCLNENCLCICDNSLIKQLKSQAKQCDDKGTCIIIPSLATSGLDLKINNADDLLFIGIRKQNNQIFVGELK
jgi:hypothetical protein